jgi:hypothetical protein
LRGGFEGFGIARLAVAAEGLAEKAITIDVIRIAPDWH